MPVLSAAAVADTTMSAHCWIASLHFDILSIPTQLRAIACEYATTMVLSCGDGPVIQAAAGLPTSIGLLSYGEGGAYVSHELESLVDRFG